METTPWMEIDLDLAGAEVKVTVRASKNVREDYTLGPAVTRDRLAAFTRAVARAIERREALGEPALDEARALHKALFQGLFTAYLREGRVLQRLMIRDPVLQGVPWEALCEPDTSEGFWGTSAHALVARGASSSQQWEPRQVREAVRVLAIAPQGGEGSLHAALAEAIDDGFVEWLDPIVGPRASRDNLFESLHRSTVPHVLHFIGHGDVDGRHPTLRLADEDGKPVWIKAEALARELAASFGDDLRLVILEACQGAAPGAFGSAAELLARAGAGAVVAHLWPIAADVARACSRKLYRTLTGSDRERGDIAVALRSVRSTLLLQSAEGFSPVLYLRGPDSVLFDLEGRTVKRPEASPLPRPLAPALQSVLDRPCALIFGDDGDDRSALRAELDRVLREHGDKVEDWMSLSALTQRYALRFGQGRLHSLFQDALVKKVASPTPPLVDGLAHVLCPGVHVTLCWLPVLERALARQQPDRTLYVLQPSLLDAEALPLLFQRTAKTTAWKVVSGPLPPFDLRSDIVVLRLYGGYYGGSSPQEEARLSPPLLTEDDQLYGLIGAEGFHPPEWADELIAVLRLRPGLVTGLSALDWRHRLLLRWLYDQAPAPKGSVALLRPETDPIEQDIWNRGGGLPGMGKIAAVREDPDALGKLLLALPVPATPPARAR
jgi:hypothetical protein